MKYSIFRTVLLLMTLTFSVGSLYAQEKFSIVVCDTQGNRLPYPEIIIGDKFHRVGTKEGKIEVDFDTTNYIDTITVKYLGYNTGHFIFDSSLLYNNEFSVMLEETTYLLDSIVISPKGFSGEEYFQEKKKNLLLPYYKRYYFDSDFSFKLSGGNSQNLIGEISGTARGNITEVDSSTLIISNPIPNISKILSALERANEISYLMSNAFCHKSDRKNFYCTYNGLVGDVEEWEFTIREQENMPWDLLPGDNLICLVYLDKDGFIKRIRTQLTSSSNQSLSYFLDTIFDRFENKIIPQTITADFVPNASATEEIAPLSLFIHYNNIRKRK